MRWSMGAGVVAAAMFASGAVVAQDAGTAKPTLVHREVVKNMPRGERQDVSVLTATLKPGDKTVFHTHRFPVTVYVLQGVFTLEMDGHETMAVRAGQSMVEPPNVRMTGYNRSATEPMRVVIFYVADPGTPFLDVVR